MEILPFNFKNYKIRTFKDKNGNIWFIAKDVADVLEIKNISDAIKDFDSNEKSDIVLNYDGSNSGKALILSESGLYSLIMRSRKPIAKPFQKWVTREVLPSIRKTGSYSILEILKSEKPKNLISVSDSELDRELKTLDYLLEKFLFSENEKRVLTNQVLERISFPTLEIQPKRKTEKVFTFTQLLGLTK
jgi:anti-repressor protein